MAMYESEGHCPSNSFFHMLLAMENQEKAVEIQKRFGDRMGYAVYAPNEAAYGECSLVKAIQNDPEFGIKLAELLTQLIPVCKYAERGRKILIHDVINPFQAAGEALFETENGFSFHVDGASCKNPVKRKGTKYLLETTNEEYDTAAIMQILERGGTSIIDKQFLDAFCPKYRYLFVIDDNSGTEDDAVDIKICKIG